ncbi:MAG: caspase family protein, partial [Microcystaceae cyanobacterium]
MLSATDPQQVAVEFLGDGFSAGLFTYALTQYLWQMTPARRVITVLSQVDEAIAPSMGKYQQPQAFLGKNTSSLLYGNSSPFSQGSEAIIEKILEPASSNLVTIRFTGVSPLLLDHGVLNSCYRVISEATADSSGDILLQVTEQTGLNAKALVFNSKVTLSGKEPLQESIRAIPRHLGLTVALDSQFDRIERVDSTSAFSAIAAVTGVINAGEQRADCVLGKKAGGYGLFTEGGRLLFSAETGNTEAIKSVIGKLTPKLEQVLAKKWCDLTANEYSSRLGLRATLAVLQDSKAIAVLTKETGRYDFSTNSALDMPPKPIKSPETPGLVSIASGSRLQYRLENHQAQPLYFVILGIDANGKAIAWYPGDQPESIPPQQSQMIPDPISTISWRVPSNRGLTQMKVIASLQPFQQFWEALAENLPNLTAPDATSHPAQILEIQNPLAIAQSLLDDLHRNSAVSSTMINNTTDYYALDMKIWAT